MSQSRLSQRSLSQPAREPEHKSEASVAALIEKMDNLKVSAGLLHLVMKANKEKIS